MKQIKILKRKRKRKKAWNWKGGDVGRIWEEKNEGKPLPNILYEKKISIKTTMTVKSKVLDR